MSFRERSAWIHLVSVLVCSAGYFAAILTGLVDARGPQAVRALMIGLGVLIVLQIGLALLTRVLSPSDPPSPRDERERLIAWRAQAIGYQVLMASVVLLGLPAHFGHPAPDLLNFALLDIVMATLAVSAAQIVMFRRGVDG